MSAISKMEKMMKGKKGNDSKYFSTTKKGEIRELQDELANQDREKKKDAVKKVIAAMTVGKDVSMLFTHVVNCIQTADVELKKLVYLYLMNYAKSNPDLAILAVNTFVKDAADQNPLIRALAVRTMGCIRVDRIVEYLCEPLRKCLRDEDPYVRKTAAICVAKMFDINAEMVVDQGFLDALRDLISDSNPTVVANAVAAMSEIADISGDRKIFKITTSILQKLLAALNECNEWGQVFILDSLAGYKPSDAREAESIIERVTPRLQHANAAVVMSAVKVIMGYMSTIEDAAITRSLSRKMAPPLVTLLSANPEIQYVALRNINLIVQRNPQILVHEIKVFFCKYNDPIYVKMEKLEIMIMLASERNIEQVLLEFKEYASEVDVDFVRRSVRAVGRCAIKLERAAERCINVLLDLIQTRVNHVVQEAIIVIKDIFRKYPNRYESVIATLCENLDTLDDPDAKASMIWIIGEYAERIENADELLDTFIDTFHDETASVQLQLLTATVKLFLKSPQNTKDTMEQILSMATDDSDNPDLRDRGYVYWRLLSTEPEAAKQVVLAEKPVISDDTFKIDPSLLDQLISNISTLASVYHKPPEAFTKISSKTLSGGRSFAGDNSDEDDSDNSDEDDSDNSDEDDSDDDDNNNKSDGGTGDLLDLMGGDMGSNNNSNNNSGGGGLMDDLFGGGGGGGNTNTTPKPKLLDASKAGYNLNGALRDTGDGVVLELDFQNQSPTPAAGFAIQFNKNSFALGPTKQAIQFNPPLQQGQSGSFTIPIGINKTLYASNQAPEKAGFVESAMMNRQKSSPNNVDYFRIPVDYGAVTTKNNQLDKPGFLKKWKELNDSEVSATFGPLTNGPNPDATKSSMEDSKFFHIANRQANGSVISYFACRLAGPPVYSLVEITFPPSGSGKNACKTCVRSDNGNLGKSVIDHIKKLLTN
jgi:AP-1 complex subunit beta-1